MRRVVVIEESLIKSGEVSLANKELGRNDSTVQIADRDIAVFRMIHEQRYMTLSQIEGAFWEGRSRSARAAYHRIAKLMKSGYLITQYSRRKRRDIFLITESAYRELEKRNLHSDLSHFRLPCSFEDSISHNLSVTDVRIVFRQMGFEDWHCERFLRKKEGDLQVPDAAFDHLDFKIALELEIVGKSKEEYEHIFETYQRNNHYFMVFYVLREQRLEWIVNLSYVTDFIWFTSYEELMNSKEKAKMRNKAGSFMLSQIIPA